MFAQLCKTLGMDFSDVSLLEEALTHRSFAAKNNERLEFLGDAVLGAIIAKALHQRFSLANEGQLSRLRSFLVRGETLAEIAKALDVGEYLRFGQGELKRGDPTVFLFWREL